MIDTNALLAEIGREAQETTVTDPALKALGEALAYPLRMGRSTTTDEAAAQIQAETGLPAMMVDGLVSWGMGHAAQALKDAEDSEAWQYVAQLVTAVAAVKTWEPADVADGLYRIMAEGMGRPTAPELYRGHLEAVGELARMDPQMPDGEAEYSEPGDLAGDVEPPAAVYHADVYNAGDETARGLGEIDGGGD
jgi:hypothetical protein